jgi:periplasmic protein TonB
MGALKRPEYESLETEASPKVADGAKTTLGAVKHNGSINPHLTDQQGVLPSGRAEGAEPATTMPNEILTQADSPSQAASNHTGHELDAFLGKAFDETPIWTGLWESVRDVFFPPKLPPLELTSQPIPVPDRMAVKRNPLATGISTTVNGLIVALILYFGARKAIDIIKPPTNLTNIDISDYKAPKAAQLAGGGGGGGDHNILEANKGKLPKIEKDPVVPPQPQTFDKPKIPEEAAINVQQNIQLPNDPNMPVIGMHSSTNVVLSAGTGSSGGMGSGSNGGLGSGNGNGFGPGTGGNAGGGLYRVGGGVSAPVPLNDVEAEFSDEARRAKYQGICEVALIVDAQGMPQNVHVIRPLGMGLDEKAIEAVRKYRFKPAMKDGKTPVPVMVTVEVNFRLY